MKLREISKAMKCTATHLSAFTDAQDYIWAILECQGCSCKILCIKLKDTAERELNKKIKTLTKGEYA